MLMSVRIAAVLADYRWGRSAPCSLAAGIGNFCSPMLSAPAETIRRNLLLPVEQRAWIEIDIPAACKRAALRRESPFLLLNRRASSLYWAGGVQRHQALGYLDMRK